ncbi:MAG: AEC family transporter [Phycisphaeraceae bacterium]
MSLFATIPAGAALEVFGELGHIAWFIVLPALILVGVGYALQRKLGMDMATLTRLNFYVLVPAIIYVLLVSSEAQLAVAGKMIAFLLGSMLCWALLALALAAATGMPRDQWRAIVLAGTFQNAGNYGLPLQQLAFRQAGLSGPAVALHVFVILVQSTTSFTIGVALAAGGGESRWRENLAHILRFPPLYGAAAAGLTILLREQVLGGHAVTIAGALDPVWSALELATDGYIAVALVTLGAQLGTVSAGGRKYPVTRTVVLRLLLAPMVTLGLLWAVNLSGLMQIEGLAAQVLLIASGLPCGVNVMLLALEFDNHPDYLARSVFYSTLVSPVTMTLLILVSRTGLVP